MSSCMRSLLYNYIENTLKMYVYIYNSLRNLTKFKIDITYSRER